MKKVKNVFDRIYLGDNIVTLSEIRYLPRWIILFIDTSIILASIFISYEIVQGLGVLPLESISFPQKYLLIMSMNILFMYLFRTFSGIIRHSTFFDVFKLALASFFTVVSLEIFNLISNAIIGIQLIRTPLLIVYFTVSFTLLIMFRIVVKEFFYLAKEFSRSSSKKRVVVVGIDQQAVAIATAVLENPTLPYQLVGFVTKRSDSSKVRLLGKPIFTKQKLERTAVSDLAFEGAIIIKEMMDRRELEDWVSLFFSKKIKLFKAPSVQKLRESDVINSIQNLQIEDLLNRRPIVIENDKVKAYHEEKTVLITGGAGSIGSEIVRQIALTHPKLIVVLDHAETPLYQIEQQCTKDFPYIEFEFVLLDIRNQDRLKVLFEKHRFSVIYHAAAYKHVPLVESNAHEAILINVFGTRNLACLANTYKVEHFVMISTDKAVNPTNVMGATKRAAELIVQSFQEVEGNTTKYITTRFGNVLGSNGSVIPLFRKQISEGGPVTITHPDIVRYFMTIPEACELVLQAGTMGNGGEVFVFDMGEPVKIIDLARRMIRLSGYEPDVDVKIQFTGLRPGEKLYEELLSDAARTLPTHHEKILISRDSVLTHEEIMNLIGHLEASLSNPDSSEVVKILKTIVPEFKSNNSKYEVLD